MSSHPSALAAALAFIALAPSTFAAEAVPHWGYGGAAGPAHWAALEPEFATCGAGREQSPIDIRPQSAQSANLPAIAFDYHATPFKLVDNGHTLQANLAPGSGITVGGHRYDLLQFHFHKPSEERIDGQPAAMVAHLVHKDAEGHLAVVAVLLQPGAINPLVATLWNNWPAHHGAEVAVPGIAIDPSELLPAERGYYTFAGSLTTPPCSEGVTWFVLKQPSTLSDGEIARFGQAYPLNARPVQPLNGRVVQATP